MHAFRRTLGSSHTSTQQQERGFDAGQTVYFTPRLNCFSSTYGSIRFNPHRVAQLLATSSQMLRSRKGAHEPAAAELVRM